MTDIRYGLIGAGMMGREHIRNLALIDGARVVAVSDPDAEQRALSAKAAGGATAFEDHRALLASGLVDALVIASPNHTHAAILRDALATNLPILVEKPLCTNAADCAEIERLAAGRRAPVWVAMEYRYMPPVSRLVEAAHSGEIGRLRMFSIREHRFPFLEKVGDWNRFNRNTGGTLVEKCCHFFDLMRLVVGEDPVRVYASGAMDVNHVDERYDGQRPDILDNAFVIVDFPGGVRAMLELCMFAEGSWFQEEIAAIGDLAKIEARVPGPARFWPGAKEREAEVVLSPRKDKQPRLIPVPVEEHILKAGDHHGSTYYQHCRFLDAVRGTGAVEVTLSDGAKAVAIGQAAEESARTGQVVML